MHTKNLAVCIEKIGIVGCRFAGKFFSKKGLLFSVLGFIFELSLKELLIFRFFGDDFFKWQDIFLFFHLKHPFLKEMFLLFPEKN